MLLPKGWQEIPGFILERTRNRGTRLEIPLKKIGLSIVVTDGVLDDDGFCDDFYLSFFSGEDPEIVLRFIRLFGDNWAIDNSQGYYQEGELIDPNGVIDNELRLVGTALDRLGRMARGEEI